MATAEQAPSIGPYRLHHELGEGSFARAYLAAAPDDGRLVVLKVAHRYDPLVEASFRQEYAFASRLRHPHLCEMLDWGVTGVGRPYLVMAWHGGTALSAWGEIRLGERELARLGLQLARGLAAIHAEGLVHRDVTPANVLVDEHGQARLGDFGLLAPAPCPARGGEGTPLYMAPEALRGEPVDARADLYALGALLYRMAAGQAPFERPEAASRPDTELLARVLREAPEPLAALAPQLSSGLTGLIMRMLAKEPADRPESAREVAAALARLVEPGTPWRAGDGPYMPPAAWRAWLDGGPRPGAFAFVGAPGLGRSRALREAFAHLRRDGVSAVRLAGEAGEEPYGLLARLWRWAAAHAPEAAAEIPAALQGVLAGLWPWAFPTAAQVLDAPRLARVLPQALLLLLRRAGVRAILIDDWGSADAASRAVLQQAWPTVLREFHWLVAAGEPVKGAETLALDGLDLAGTNCWLAAVLEHDEAGTLAARLHEASHGNPGWMAQAVAHLATTGEPGLPASVEAMLEATWSASSADQRALAEALAVWGQPFTHADLEPISASLPAGWPLELGALAARGVLCLTGGRYHFAHGWWPAWIRARLAAARRARLAGELARALEAAAGVVSAEAAEPALAHRLASLYAQADAPEPLATWALAAGRAAARLWANQEALGHFEAGLAAIAAHGEPGRLREAARAMRLAQADVRRVVGDLVPAAEAYQAALADAPMAVERAHVLISLGKCRQMLNDLPGAAEVLEEASMLLRPLDPGPAVVEERVRALTTLGRVRFYAGDRAAAAAAYEDALVVARAHDVRGYMAEALAFLGTLLAGSAESAERGLALLGEALALREADGDPLGRLDTHNLLGTAYMGLGRVRDARRHFEANRALAAEVGYRQEEALGLVNLALCDADQGRRRDALARLDQAIAIAAPIGYDFLLGFARYAESLARLHLGDPAGMEAALAEAREREAALGSPYLRQYGLAYEAERHLFLGAFESARRAAELAVAAIARAGGGELLLRARLLLAEALIHGGELAEGGRELLEAQALVEAAGAAAPRAQLGRLAGWLAHRRGQPDEARAAWREALALARAEELDGLEAELLLALHALDRRGGSTDGQAALSRAYELAERHRAPEQLALACLGLALEHVRAGEDLLAERLSRRGHDLLARFVDALPSAGARAAFLAHPLRAPFCEARDVEEAHRLVRHGRRLEMLLELARALGASRHPDGVLERVRAFTRELTQAERCLVLLAGPGSQELRPWGEDGDEPYSRTIVARVCAARAPECVLDTRESADFKAQASIVDMQLRSVMCVPLLVEQVLHGVLYVDSRVALGAFGPADLRMLEAIAAQAAIALDNARLFQAMRLQADKQAAYIRQLEERDTTIAALREWDRARTAAFEAESHDLRAPLAAVNASCQALLKGLMGELTPDQAEAVEGVHLNARLLTTKIDGVLDAASLEAGKLVLRLGAVDLARVVGDVARGLRPSAEAKGLNLRLDEGALAGVPRVRGDDRRLGQVVQNLVDNAIKYTDAGEVVITAAREGELVRLVVADTGRGLPPGRLVAPFERYGARDARDAGSGVGLWRVKSLVDQHGGDISLESEVGRGTRVAVRLPIAP